MLKFAEAVMVLYCALRERDSCPSCGGSGTHWVMIDEDDVSAEPCECEEIARYALERYQPQFKAAMTRYFKEKHIIPTEEGKKHDALMIHLFSEVR